MLAFFLKCQKAWQMQELIDEKGVLGWRMGYKIVYFFKQKVYNKEELKQERLALWRKNLIISQRRLPTLRANPTLATLTKQF